MISDEDAEKFGEVDLTPIATGKNSLVTSRKKKEYVMELNQTVDLAEKLPVIDGGLEGYEDITLDVLNAGVEATPFAQDEADFGAVTDGTTYDGTETVTVN